MLPSTLQSTPAYQDGTTTIEQYQIAQASAKVTSPDQTAIFICGLKVDGTDCNRLYPSRDRLMQHRKREHDTESEEDIITWND